MIGDESTVLRSPSSPTSTGHVFIFSHLSTASLSSSGGSISETNSPAWTSRVVWVETKVCLSVLSRSSPPHGVVLVILTVILKVPLRRSSASTCTAPHSGRQLRTTAPTTSPAGSSSGSSVLPPAISISTRSEDSANSETLKRPTAISRSTASSHARYSSPPARNSSTNSSVSPVFLATLCSTTCRKRTLTSMPDSSSPDTRHSVCMIQGSSPPLASL